MLANISNDTLIYDFLEQSFHLLELINELKKVILVVYVHLAARNILWVRSSLDQ